MLSIDSEQNHDGPLTIRQVTRIVPEIELAQIAVQVTLAHMVVNPYRHDLACFLPPASLRPAASHGNQKRSLLSG